MPFLLIDTSYSIFYRYFATHRWYYFAHREDKFDDDYDWIDNEIFKQKFESKFFESFSKIIKEYNIPLENIVFARDCPRSEIWRNLWFSEYKANRDEDCGDDSAKPFKGGPFFKYTYSKILPELVNSINCKVIKHDNLEADDIIYLTKKYLRNKYPEEKIIIVGSDCDLLQILDDKTVLIDLKNKIINNKSCGDPKTDLEIKIICGDKSDNIPSCFPKCGPKTAMKLIENKELLGEKFKKYPESLETYARNKTIIDLSCIPDKLQESCNEEIFKYDL